MTQIELNQLAPVIHDLYYNQRLSQTKIDKQLGFPEGRTSRLMKQLNMKARSDREKSLKYTCDEHYFDTIDSEEKAYWLGFLYADGYIQSARKHSSAKVGISLMEADCEHLHKFARAVQYTGEIKHYVADTSYSKCPYCRILISSPTMAEALIAKGCIEHKTDCLLFPTNDVVPDYLIRHFVRGYIDGNGSITHGGNKDGYIYNHSIKICASKEFLQELLQWLGKPDLVMSKRHKDRDTNTYGVTIGGSKQTAAILERLYGNCAIYLDRKYERYLAVIQAQTKRM